MTLATEAHSAVEQQQVNDGAQPAQPVVDTVSTEQPKQSLHDIQMEAAKRLLSGDPEKDDTKPDEKAAGAKTPPRAPDGKFTKAAPADGDAKTEVPADGKPEAETKSDSEPNAGDPAQVDKSPPSEPPAYLSPDLKARWDKIEPEVREAISASALNDRQTISRLGNTLQQYEPFREFVTEYRSYFESSNLHPVQVTRNLMAWNVALEKDPAAALPQLAKAYGVDLSSLYASKQPQQQPADDFGLPPDPHVSALQQEIDSLKSVIARYDQQIRGVTSHLSSQEQAQREWQEQQYEAQIGSVETEIAKFQAGNPDFNALLQSGELGVEIAKLQERQPDLPRDQLIKTAFERAQWANPQMRAKAMAAHQASERKAAEEKAQKDKAAAAAAKAKAAASANVRGLPNGNAAPPASVKDAQSEVLRRHGLLQ